MARGAKPNVLQVDVPGRHVQCRALEVPLLRQCADLGDTPLALPERLQARPQGDTAEQRLHRAADQHGAGAEPAHAELSAQNHVATEGRDPHGGDLGQQHAAFLTGRNRMRQLPAQLGGAVLQALVAPLEQGLGTQHLHGMNAVQGVEQEIEATFFGHREIMSRAADTASGQRRQQLDAGQERQGHQDQRTCQIPDAEEVEQRERQVEHRLQGGAGPGLAQGADRREALGVIAVAVGLELGQGSIQQALHGLAVGLGLRRCRDTGKHPAAHVAQERLQKNRDGHRRGKHRQGPDGLVRQDPVIDLEQRDGKRQREQGDEQRRLDHRDHEPDPEAADQASERACQPGAGGHHRWCRGRNGGPIHNATNGLSAERTMMMSLMKYTGLSPVWRDGIMPLSQPHLSERPTRHEFQPIATLEFGNIFLCVNAMLCRVRS